MTDIETITTRLADKHGVTWQARDIEGRTDRPESMGGANAGPMASEHVLIALASCTTTTAVKIAAKRNIRLDDIQIEASMAFDDRGLVESVRLQITVDSPDATDAVAKLFDLAERSCTISKLLAVDIERTIIHHASTK